MNKKVELKEAVRLMKKYKEVNLAIDILYKRSNFFFKETSNLLDKSFGLNLIPELRDNIFTDTCKYDEIVANLICLLAEAYYLGEIDSKKERNEKYFKMKGEVK